MTGATFTAEELSCRLSLSARGVRKRLANVPASGARIVAGNQSATWAWAQLPKDWQAILSAAPSQSPDRPAWQPPIPLSELAPDCIEAATKLQRALSIPLERIDDPHYPAADGVIEFAKVFGYRVSERHWRGLFMRTVRRDGSRRDWNNLAIFLPDRLKRRRATVKAIDSGEFAELAAIVSAFKNPARPSADEKSLIWLETFRLLESQVAEGIDAKALTRRLLEYLWRHVPALAKTKNALRVAFKFKLDAWRAADRQAGVLADRRHELRGVPKATPYDPDQVDLIGYTAATRTGGRRAQAARELNAQGLITDPRIKASLDTATSKTYLPKSLRDELTDVPAFHVCHLGQRAAKKMVPSIQLDHDGILVMDCWSGDDMTTPAYCAVPNVEGWFDVIRPQFIPVIDERSLRVLGRGIIRHPQYTAFDVLCSFKRPMMLYGLPKQIKREGGIWRKSRLVNSLAAVGTNRTADRPFSLAETVTKLERLGVRISDSSKDATAGHDNLNIRFRESFRPCNKPVERVIGRLQDYMERFPSYSGRDERIDCPERCRKMVDDVRARRLHPNDAGLPMFEALRDQIDDVIRRYNAEKQEGRRLRHPITGQGLSPDDAFELFRNVNDPPVQFSAECAVVLSHMRIKVRVKSPDIRRRQYPAGFVTVMDQVYCSADTGRLIGRELLAFYDPEMPETITLTDLNMRHPVTVPRLESTNALAINEQTSASIRQARSPIAALRGDFQAMAAKFEPVLRRNLVSPRIVELNTHVQTERVKEEKRQRQESSRAGAVRRKARNLGLPEHLVETSEQNKAALDLMEEARQERERELKDKSAGKEKS